MERRRLLPIVDHIEEHIITVFLIVMTALTFINVLSRYIFNWSISFTFEFVTSLFLWSTMLGSAAAFTLGEHMSLGIGSTLFPPVVGRFLRLLSYVASVVVFSLLMYHGSQMVQSQLKVGQITPGLGWPEAAVSMAIPLGSALVIVRVVQAGYRDLLRK